MSLKASAYDLEAPGVMFVMRRGIKRHGGATAVSRLAFGVANRAALHWGVIINHRAAVGDGHYLPLPVSSEIVASRCVGIFSIKSWACRWRNAVRPLYRSAGPIMASFIVLIVIVLFSGLIHHHA